MKTITIRVSDRLESELKEVSKASGISQSEVVREALQTHLRLQRFRRMKKDISPFAEAQGYLTDEDIFNDSSFS